MYKKKKKSSEGENDKQWSVATNQPVMWSRRKPEWTYLALRAGLMKFRADAAELRMRKAEGRDAT